MSKQYDSIGEMIVDLSDKAYVSNMLNSLLAERDELREWAVRAATHIEDGVVFLNRQTLMRDARDLGLLEDAK